MGHQDGDTHLCKVHGFVSGRLFRTDGMSTVVSGVPA
jgi:hypothetical protein